MENKDYQKRVAAIHDLSGFGKCSLTVALPDIFLFLFYRFYSCFINWLDRFLNIVAFV